MRKSEQCYCSNKIYAGRSERGGGMMVIARVHGKLKSSSANLWGDLCREKNERTMKG